MYNFGFQKSLGEVVGKLGELIEDFERNEDVYNDGFNAIQLERLVQAKELIIQARVALVEASVDD